MSSRCFQGMRIDSFLISANLHTVCYGSIPGWCLSTTAIVNLVPMMQYSPQCRKWLQMQQALIPRQQPRRRAQTVPSQRFGRSLTMHHAVQSRHLVLRLHRCKSRCATNSTCPVESPLDRSLCPFVWWVANQQRFPRLAKVGRQMLNVPATSVTSERLFSKVGNIISKKRNLLAPSTADHIVFLIENM